MRAELLKGSSVSDYNPEYTCSIDGCDEEMVVIDCCKYYCSKHWNQELGFRKEK
jgi:hypothetical protein